MTGEIFVGAILLGCVVGVVVAALADLFVRSLQRARICAWCPPTSRRRVLRGGYLPASHTICETCRRTAG